MSEYHLKSIMRADRQARYTPDRSFRDSSYISDWDDDIEHDFMTDEM